ncbi:DUF3164 family protein [Roseobacter sp. S98]|uniref:DUF3164 family protein n=1 Tax=Roseobacter algicola (ex Choi et al. 2025) (nom. illeg.) TaxID=3092138 RepID=UPI0035C69B33
MTTEFTPAPVPTGRRTIAGKEYMHDAKGGMIPADMVKPQTQLEDETVRKILGFWIAASGQISRLKAHVLDDIMAFEGILAQEYGTTIGGRKGNKSLLSFDGLMKVEVRIADFIDFGPELQVAKELVDQCLNEWAEDARPEIRAVITNAFHTDKAGQVNRAEIIRLMRLDIDEERWNRAMDAIRDAQRVVGQKSYVRCYRRDSFDAPWRAVSIDMAKA